MFPLWRYGKSYKTYGLVSVLLECTNGIGKTVDEKRPIFCGQGKRVRRATMNKTYSFDAGDAKQYGIDEAIFLEELRRWIKHNKVQKRNEKEGKTWVYNTREQWAEAIDIFPEWKIKKIVASLREQGVIETKQFGGSDGNKFNKQNWITVSSSNGPKSSHPIGPKSHQSDSPKSDQCNNKVTEKIPEKLPELRSEKTAFRDMANPRYSAHRKIAEQSLRACGHITPSKKEIEDLIGVLDDLTDEWPIEEQGRLIPLILARKREQGDPISSLTGFLRRRDGQGHPYGDIVSDERLRASIQQQKEAADRQKASEAVYSKISTKDGVKMFSEEVKKLRGSPTMVKGSLKEVVEVAETDDDIRKAEAVRQEIKRQLEQLQGG